MLTGLLPACCPQMMPRRPTKRMPSVTISAAYAAITDRDDYQAGVAPHLCRCSTGFRAKSAQSSVCSYLRRATSLRTQVSKKLAADNSRSRNPPLFFMAVQPDVGEKTYAERVKYGVRYSKRRVVCFCRSLKYFRGRPCFTGQFRHSQIQRSQLS